MSFEKEYDGDISSSGYPGHAAPCPRCGKNNGWEYPNGGSVQECEQCSWAIEAEIDSRDVIELMKYGDKNEFERERMKDKTRGSSTCSRCRGSGTIHSNDDEAWEMSCPKCGGNGCI
jgi:DNA-directed RNA polymerase subunit RPC12/RpoP